MKTIKLPKDFIGVGSVKDFQFKQVYSNEKGYIYSVGEVYEVFYKKTTPICLNFAERIYSETEEKEMYPKDKDFGVWAWCVDSVERGKEILG